MAAPLDAPIPPGLALSGGYTIRFTALDPTSGDEVTDVVISGATVQYEVVAGSTSVDLPSGPYLYQPTPSAPPVASPSGGTV